MPVESEIDSDIQSIYSCAEKNNVSTYYAVFIRQLHIQKKLKAGKIVNALSHSGKYPL